MSESRAWNVYFKRFTLQIWNGSYILARRKSIAPLFYLITIKISYLVYVQQNQIASALLATIILNTYAKMNDVDSTKYLELTKMAK